MIVLHIEHRIPDFATWKANFDSDPVDRRGSGVLSYTVARGVDDPNHVAIDLRFAEVAQAQALVDALSELWKRVLTPLGVTPTVQIMELVEETSLASV